MHAWCSNHVHVHLNEYIGVVTGHAMRPGLIECAVMAMVWPVLM
jgi:hypothetical protein